MIAHSFAQQSDGSVVVSSFMTSEAIYVSIIFLGGTIRCEDFHTNEKHENHSGSLLFRIVIVIVVIVIEAPS